jgi:hypothetical protein
MPFVEVFASGVPEDRKKMICEQLVAAAVLAAPDDQPDRLYSEPVAWVQVIDIAEGAWGALGRPVRFPEIANYVTTGAFAHS